MIHHRPFPVFAALCLLAFAAAAASGALIPSNVKSSSTPSAFHVQIVDAINKEAAALATGNQAAVQTAREHLIAEAEGHEGVVATPEYQAEYAADLVPALAPLIAPTQQFRVQLNAAVVAGRVAEIVHSGGAADQFAKLADAMLKDKQPAVVIWGMKTAKYVLGSLVQKNHGNTGGFDKLVVNAVKTHADSGPLVEGQLVEEAYGALTLEPYQKSSEIGTLTAAVLPAILDLMQFRTEQYRSQDLPPKPMAEVKVDRFLPIVVGKGFSAINASPETKKRTLKVVAEMTCAIIHVIADGNANEDLIGIVKENGSALAAFGDQLDDKGLITAGGGIKDLNMTSSQLAARCNALRDALKALGVTIESPFGADNEPSSVDNSPRSSTDAPAVAGSGK